MAGSGARVASGKLLATLAAGVGLALLIFAVLTYQQLSPSQGPPPRPAATTTTAPPQPDLPHPPP